MTPPNPSPNSPAWPCHYVFWQSTPSPHLAPFIRALAGLPAAASVTVALAREFQPERAAMGWQAPDFGAAQVVSTATAAELLEQDPATAVHIFSEYVSDPLIRAHLKQAAHTAATLAILSEGRDWRDAKGALRRLHGLALDGRHARRMDFVLAIGHLAAAWFGRCGFARERIFDFAYTVERPAPFGDPAPVPGSGARLLFVGQLIRRKRPDLLLRSLQSLPGDWNLRLVGDGPEAAELLDFVRAAELLERVRFLGVQDNRAVRRELAEADVLVLPSRWDGWGAVVNEALMSGTRVVCSDFCGAADLIRDTPYGSVFRCGSRDALASALAVEMRRGPVRLRERSAIRAYGESVAGPALAAYFVGIVEHIRAGRPRPIPPWIQYKEQSHGPDPR